MDGYEKILAFVTERHNIAIKRERGESWPWTSDPILQKYRFCNIYREKDTVTRWLRQNWFAPHADDPDLWFAAAVARHVNLPVTLGAVGYPVPWRPARFTQRIRNRMADELPAFSGAYMIKAGRVKGTAKVDSLAAMLGELWENRAYVRPRPGQTLQEFWARLTEHDGIGSFMAAQVVADAKFHGVLGECPDWWTFAAPGPGSMLGLNRVLGRPANAGWRLEEWREENLRLCAYLNEKIPGYWDALCAQDTQNCMCEFSKYMKAVDGTGKPKQLFRSRV